MVIFIKSVSNVNIRYPDTVSFLFSTGTFTRPDIAFTVGKAGRKMQSPTTEDLTKVKRIFQYINANSTLGLNYSENRNTELIGYTDADWAGN